MEVKNLRQCVSGSNKELLIAVTNNEILVTGEVK